MNIVLTLADIIGFGRSLGPSSSLIFFDAWPKNQRIRYWASDIEKVMILSKKRPVTDAWYDLRFFFKNGTKTNHTVSEATLRNLQHTTLQIATSPRFKEIERQQPE